MAYDLSINVQAQTGSAPQQKINRLIEKIEQQKQTLEMWKLLRDEIRQYRHNTLIPVYRDLHGIWFEQMCALCLTLQNGSYTQAEIRQIDHKIMDLAERLKSAQVLSDAQRNRVDEVHRFYQQHQIKPDPDRVLMHNQTHISQHAEAKSTHTPHADWDSVEIQMQQQMQAREQAKIKQRQQKHELAMQRATQSLKMVYLKITAMIHPDRESDPNQKEIKTELLQQVNTAYAEQDLFYLLKIQLQLEQKTNTKALSKEQIKFYQMSLDAQSQHLQQQLEDIFASFDLSPDLNLKQLKKQDICKAIDRHTAILKRQLKQERLRLQYLKKDRGAHVLMLNEQL